ncbi:MAG: DNA polymerase III subunit alpha [Candidatus Dasytiphilus stammeri]
MNAPKFIHLRVHSDYSLRDGLAKVTMLVDQTVKLGMPAIAITDFTNIFGIIKFYRYAHEVGIKPIIGSDFQIAHNNDIYQITVLAMNNTGYKNLILLISRSYQNGFSVVKGPIIKYSWLIEFAEGLILLSGGVNGDVGDSILKGNQHLVLEKISFYKKFFPDRYYLELIRTGRRDEENYLQTVIAFAINEKLPVVATNEVCFINPSDFHAHEIRVAIHNGIPITHPKHISKYSQQQYLRSIEEMCHLFSDIPEALENTIEIAKRCTVTLNIGNEYFLPQFPTGSLSIEKYFRSKSQQGLEQRLNFLFHKKTVRNKKRLTYERRLEMEIEVINKMGLAGYFLIVMEFIQWAKNNNIPVGPGRGSGAGSLVAYALKITDIDPLAFDLLFERFLNPERVSMPDFDIDFCMEKRDQVIEHMTHTYGRGAVAQIITFGTLTAKIVIRDVGRILGYSYNFVDRIAKLIPPNPNITLAKAFKITGLVELYNSNEEVKVLLDIACQLEGVTRNVSKHAGGVVIAPTKITDFVPIYCDENGNHPVTQFDKNDIEYVGLVKFDFLGLRTLTIIHWALKMINQLRLKQGYCPIKIDTIPLDDKKSFAMLQQTETTAIFQLESRGMRDLIKRLKPDSFEDIIALVALFRPGPLHSGMVDNFINRKHKRENIAFPDRKWQHFSLKKVLAPTYGIILYQEQVMQIAQVLAGYTLGQADILRLAMGKKKKEEMAQQRSFFRLGAKKKGIDAELSMRIFDLVEKFAGYGFNKSHSAAYALISYQTLWLKTHYPAEFISAVMTAEMVHTEKIVELVKESVRIGIKVLKPNINTGMYYFYVNDDRNIVYGLGAIKGVGKGPIEAIIEARDQKGKYFSDLFDLCLRTNTNKINRRVLEKLIMSGAFDDLGPHRAVMLHNVETALKVANQKKKNKRYGQKDIFNINDISPIYSNNVRPWTKDMILSGERETLGMYISGHPIKQYIKEIEYYTKGLRLKDIHSLTSDQFIKIAGIVISTSTKFTKMGNYIGIIRLYDMSSDIKIILFSNVFKKYKFLLEKDKILIVSGKNHFDKFSKQMIVIANKLIDINEARQKYTRRLAIAITHQSLNKQIINNIIQCLEKYKTGTVPVYFYYSNSIVQVNMRLSTIWQVSINNHLINELRALLGFNNVILEFD